MEELVDSQSSDGCSFFGVWVRLPPLAPYTMIKTLTLSPDKTIEITIRKTSVNKSIRLSVYKDGRVLITSPKRTPQYVIDNFLVDRSEWLKIRVAETTQKVKLSAKEYKDYKTTALERVWDIIKSGRFDEVFSFNRITIKNTRSRWGSCSSKKNLSFTYKIIFLPEELQQYLVIHELCHLKHFNHSKDYWNLVETYLPNYKSLDKALSKANLGSFT